MDRASRIVLLGVLGIGVFLSGLELMITAVALPTIVIDLATWSDLRRASWIINAYLLVFVATMPLAGRLSDLWGARRLFLGALAIFTIGSLVAGMSQTLDQLILGRVIQAVGGGALVPVGTAAASHLFDGHARARALGVIAALTFLGMAAGPFVGAAILTSFRVEPTLLAIGVGTGLATEFLAPAWRWVFYVNVPIGLCALLLGWAATADWDTERRPGRVDLLGAVLFTAALAGVLAGVTLIGSTDDAGAVVPSTILAGCLVLVGLGAGVLAIRHGFRHPDPFLDPRLFRDRVFSSAALVSLLTGYAFAIAIVGGAVFVDRVLYGGADQQRLALGALAGATAVGALASGLAVRLVSLRLVTLVGLLMSAFALWRMSTWTSAVGLDEVAVLMALFGLGFGLTVTPRSTAAVEAVGRHLFGAASATVTVARMIGMAVGLAVLTAYGSTAIDRLTARVFATADGYREVIPEELRGRPLKDPLVVDALEAWASSEAARTMVGLFLVGALVVLVAIPPGLALGGRPRILSRDHAAEPAGVGGSDGGDVPETEPTLAL